MMRRGAMTALPGSGEKAPAAGTGTVTLPANRAALHDAFGVIGRQPQRASA